MEMAEKQKKQDPEELEQKETQEMTAAEEAQEKDLQLEAEMLMKSEGIDKIYRAGAYWFREKGSAEEHAHAVGGAVAIYEKK